MSTELDNPRQADLLARFLSLEPGSAPPAELEQDVVEALYALRPDLAPAPRLRIEEVLAEVREGPFAQVDRGAVEALVAWLGAHPGAEPPAAIDPEVVEAVYALRPDLAPAPRVSLDDILGSVASGPFLQAPPENVIAFPGGAPQAARPAPVRKAVPAPNRRFPAWALPGLGALAAAAAALVLVVPARSRLDAAPSPFSAEQTLEARKGEASPPPPPSAAAPAPDAMPTTGAPGLADAPSTVLALEAEQKPSDAALARGPLAVGGENTMTEAAKKDAGQQPARDQVMQGLDDALAGGALHNEEAAGPQGQASWADLAAPKQEAQVPAAQEPAAEAPVELATTATRATSTVGSIEVDRQREARRASSPSSKRKESADADETAAEESADMGWSPSEGGRAAPAEPTAPSTAARPPAPAPASPAASAPALGSAAGDRADGERAEEDKNSLDRLRDQAWPLGALPDASVGRPEVVAAHLAAAAAEQRGDDSAYLAALQALLAHPDAQVAQDAAVRVARRQLAMGRTRDCLATVDLGLRRGSQGPMASRLYALRGQAWERLGAAESALDAYKDAVEAR